LENTEANSEKIEKRRAGGRRRKEEEEEEEEEEVSLGVIKKITTYPKTP